MKMTKLLPLKVYPFIYRCMGIFRRSNSVIYIYASLLKDQEMPLWKKTLSFREAKRKNAFGRILWENLEFIHQTSV